MAEPRAGGVGAPLAPSLPDPTSGRAADLAAYRAVLASRLRAQTAYPLPFAVDLLGSLLTGLMEVAEVWIVYHNVAVLGGLTFGASLLVYALASTAFAVLSLTTRPER